eukprot:scaffold16934_cov80-Phaeocystis_antarctica.AAC.5
MAFPSRGAIVAHAAHFGGLLTLEIKPRVQSTVLPWRAARGVASQHAVKTIVCSQLPWCKKQYCLPARVWCEGRGRQGAERWCTAQASARARTKRLLAMLTLVQLT